MARKPTWKIPFTKEGSILEYAEGYAARDVDRFVDADWTIEAALEVVDWGRGRSAATFYLRNLETEADYPMKMAAFTDMVMKGVIRRGVVVGKFGVKKQGANYSLYMIEAHDPLLSPTSSAVMKRLEKVVAEHFKKPKEPVEA